MEVRLKTYGTIREAIGTKEMKIYVPEKTTVDEFLDIVAEESPELEGVLVDSDDEIMDGITVTKNKIDLSLLDNSDRQLSAGDVIRAAPSLEGG